MSNYNKKTITILILIISTVSSIFLSGCTDETNNVITDKWLFAMDNTDYQNSVQYRYNATGIPTLVIIDKDGDVIFYSRGKPGIGVLMNLQARCSRELPKMR